MGDVRVAVICLGYLGNPAGVARLAGYFAAARARMYVHIDANVEIGPYRAALAGHDHVVLLDRRHRIYWGGFSLVRATIDAIAAARADADFDRVCLLTEDTVPLVDATTFRAMMAEPCEYMHVYHDLSPALWRRYHGFYLFDSDATNHRTIPEEREISPQLLGALQRLEALRERGKLPIERLYHGSTWWALTGRAIDEIMLHWANSEHMRVSFEFSMIPEEQYFHTILGNAARRFSFRPFIHVDFNRAPRPFVYRTEAELTSLRGTPLLFARKAALDSAEATRFVEMLSG